MSIIENIKNQINPHLSCRDADGFIYEYLEGTLKPSVAKRFKIHLDMCKNCTLLLDQYKSTLALIKDAAPVSPPDELVEHTLAFLSSKLTAGTQNDD